MHTYSVRELYRGRLCKAQEDATLQYCTAHRCRYYLFVDLRRRHSVEGKNFFGGEPFERLECSRILSRIRRPVVACAFAGEPSKKSFCFIGLI